jgi:hypothetical protein
MKIKPKFTSKQIIICLTIAVVVALLAFIGIKFHQFKFEEREKLRPIDQIMVEGRIVSLTDIGILVELAESSSFSTLMVEIPNDDLPTRFDVGTYVNIYYDGVIIDASPAKFQIVYDVIQAQGDQTEQKTYSDWNIPNISIDELDQDDLAKVTTTIQSYLSSAGNTTLVSINSLLGSRDSKDDAIEAYLCKVQYNGTTVEEWRVIYVLKQEYDCGVIKVTSLELMAE